MFYENEYKGRLQSFMVSEKLRIVRVAEEIGNRAAGQKYDVPESCIRDWRKKKEMLLKSSGTRTAFCG
jgi:transposase-like protein